ncbi:MAG: hypothetical protein Q9220_002951 [cf. Caloplaca sp. 1 TL-2023]
MPPKNGKGMTWDAPTKAQLLQCYFLRHPVKVDYAGLEADMRALGHDCTAKAITHQFGHMRSNSKSGVTVTTNGDTGSDTTPAPKESAAVSKTASKATPAAAANSQKSRGKAKNGINAENGTGGNKRKRAVKSAAAALGDSDEEITGDGSKEEEDAHAGKKVKVEDAAGSSEDAGGEEV